MSCPLVMQLKIFRTFWRHFRGYFADVAVEFYTMSAKNSKNLHWHKWHKWHKLSFNTRFSAISATSATLLTFPK